MKRWHEEVPLMTRRWRKELATHAYHNGYCRRYGYDCMAPPGIACDIDCHCANGIGTMRKNRLDCGNVRCGLCHWGKFWEPKRRGATKRKVIEFELEV